MNQEKIRIGILGTASIAQRSVIPAILTLPERFELTGIASRSIDHATALATKHQCKVFAPYEDMIDKAFIDAVYIPLPNSMHYDWVKLALSKGIHVLVEKSLACSLEEVQELNDLARSTDLSIIESFQFRFHRQLNIIRELIHLGVIGDLRYIRSSFEFPPFPDAANIRYQKSLGGGALLDAGAYPLKIAQMFMGYGISVKAACLRYSKELGVDVGGGAFLKQDDGDLFAEVSFGFDNFYQCSIELSGKLGKISTNRVFTAPSTYKPVIQIEVAGKPVQLLETEADDAFVNIWKHFYQTIFNPSLREEEYIQNINQARLIHELIFLANAK